MTRTLRFLVVALATSLPACGGHAALTSAGEEKGDCYPNSTCNPGLSCFSNKCVRYSAGESTGAAGNIRAATGGAAGVTGAAGAVGGSGSLGASGAVGAGGMDVGGDSNDGGGRGGATSSDDASDMDGAPDATEAGAGGSKDASSIDACSGALDRITVEACGYMPGTTAFAYSGLVTMTITGLFVNAPGQPLEDAFYSVDLNDSSQTTGTCPECFRFNRFGEGDCVCSYECAANSHAVSGLLIGTYPTFSPSHDYSVTLNLGSGPPERIHFGMADCGCHDNSGTHTVTITPLAGGTCIP